MKATRPIHKDQFLSKRDKMCKGKYEMVYRCCPSAFVLDCWAVCRYYYGGSVRAAFRLLYLSFYLWANSLWHGFLLWVTDRMGWTKLYDHPESTPDNPFRIRHGRYCSGSPNCNNWECIAQGIPKWFRWLTRWDKK